MKLSYATSQLFSFFIKMCFLPCTVYNFNFIFIDNQDVFNISKLILMLADRLHFHMWPTIPQQI